MPAAPGGGYEVVAESVRAQMEALALPNPSAPRKNITVSIGAAATMPVAGKSVHAFIQMADEALYLAKSEGRNAVRISDQEVANVKTGRFERPNFVRLVK